MTEKLLMPKATAAWLIQNTKLTFDQISEFVGMHVFEIQAMADGETLKTILPRSPISSNQLTAEEITLCEEDPTRRISLNKSDLPPVRRRVKGPRYTPLVKRAEKPDAIAWLVRHHPELNDTQITRLVGTTRPIIQSIRDRTHWNFANIKMRSPVELGLTSQEDLDRELNKHASDDKKNHASDDKKNEKNQSTDNQSSDNKSNLISEETQS